MTDTDNDRRADDEPSFDRPRRAVLLGAGTALTGALAGCSGGGGDGDDDGGDGTEGDGGDGSDGSDGSDGGDGTTAGSDGTTAAGDGGVTGSVTQNDIDGIEVTDVQAEITDETGGSADATVTFENTGDETITYLRRTPPYSWTVTVLDADGEPVDENSDPAVFWAEDTDDDVASGETGTINLGSSPLNDATEVAASVEVTIACATDKDNAYC